MIDPISIRFRFDFEIRLRIDSIHSLNLVCNFELDIESLRVVDKFCLPEIPAIARGTGFFICVVCRRLRSLVVRSFSLSNTRFLFILRALAQVLSPSARFDEPRCFGGRVLRRVEL